MRYYEEFFGIEYPLPKMDMIALPDFNAGAMENWGLITYRETSMLFDEAGSSIANKQRVATVVAHELAHQWFGNLVTPKWWDDLWLNEGFASYVEYIGVDKIEPTWKILDQFATEELQNVFRVDDLSSSHQISIPVNDPEEISEIFDHISYAKSASVIRMMHYFLTPEVFQVGLRRYLRALKYSNAEQSDLWAHLSEASRLVHANNSQLNSTGGSKRVEPVDVGKVMNSWTLQVGYPLVTLTRHYGGSRRAQLDQVRYRPTLEQQQQQQLANKNGSQPVQKWEVPVTYTWKSERNFEPITRVWLHQNDSGPVELDRAQLPAADDDWMLINLGQVGYYRVNYDLQNWRLLIKQLNEDHRVIGTTNRAQLLDDIFELARSGSLDYKFALDSTKYLKSERDFLPWDTVLTSFGYIDEMLQRTPLYGQWQDYVADLIRPYYSRYKDSVYWTMPDKSLASTNGTAVAGAGDDNALEQYNLVNAISWACQVDQHCVSKSKSLFRRWKEGGQNNINPVVRFTVYCTAVENGNKDDWDFLWRAYEKEQNSSERDRILKSLSCSREIWILSRYLEWTFNKSKPIRRQDGSFIFRMIAKNNYGRDIAFNFVRERWTTIREHYGKTSFSLGALIRSLSYAMNTQIELNQLTSFYESVKSDVGTGKRSFQNAIEEVETNVQWRNRNYKILEDWITEARSTAAATAKA